MSITIDPPELLFPHKVISSHNTEFHSYKDSMLGWMDSYIQRNPTSNERSNAGGYQSPDDFYLEESFAPFLNILSEQIMSTLDSYMHDTLLEDEDPLTLSNMWFNYNYRNCYNVCHTHPGCAVAGVFWIQVPEESPLIVFDCPVCHNSSVINPDTTRRYQPSEGTMLMFPAYLPHRVDLNDNDTTRISISFNLVQ